MARDEEGWVRERDVDPVYANGPIQVGRSVLEVRQQRNPGIHVSVTPVIQTRGGGRGGGGTRGGGRRRPQGKQGFTRGKGGKRKPRHSHAFERIQLSSGDLIEPIVLKRADERVLGDPFM